MDINNLTDLEFSELLSKCIDRLEKENTHHVVIKRAWNSAVIIIDQDEEVNEQLDSPHTKHGGWVDFSLMLSFTKRINQF